MARSRVSVSAFVELEPLIERRRRKRMALRVRKAHGVTIVVTVHRRLAELILEPLGLDRLIEQLLGQPTLWLGGVQET